MPPSACSKRPDAARVGAGEGALLVAEQLGLDQVARDRRHVDGDERPVAPLAVIVQRARDQFLAGAGLAGDHHGQIGLHQPRQHAVDFLHRRRAADQRDGAEILDLRRLARALLRLGQRAPDDRDQLLQVERLRQIFVGAALGGADRRHERVLRAHHDDRQIGPQLLDARQQVERVLVRHHHVGDDQIAVALAHPAPQRRGIAGRAHLVAGARQRLVEHRADRGVVVGDQYVSCGHGSSSGSAARQGVVPCEHRHQDAENGVSRLRLAFDDAAVIADDLGHQCKTEASSGRLGGHERIEQDAASGLPARPGRCP